MMMLNLGCGSTCHPDWVNVDAQPLAPGVMVHDLRTGIPFPDEHFDVVYHSHVLEHFAPEAGRQFLRESLRVLKTGGILRVVVPDLESSARLYLQKLEDSLAGQPGAGDDYDWMLIELLDQHVRMSSGGMMARYFAREIIPNLPFVRSRIGVEADKLLENARGPGKSMASRLGTVIRGAAASPGRVARRVRHGAALAAAGVAGGREAVRSLRDGTFRHSGETHQWMYDRYSLPKLLDQLGVHSIEVCDAFHSRIAGFSAYQLDTLGGDVRKPGSIFVEGIKAGGRSAAH